MKHQSQQSFYQGKLVPHKIPFHRVVTREDGSWEQNWLPMAKEQEKGIKEKNVCPKIVVWENTLHLLLPSRIIFPIQLIGVRHHEVKNRCHRNKSWILQLFLPNRQHTYLFWHHNLHTYHHATLARPIAYHYYKIQHHALVLQQSSQEGQLPYHAQLHLQILIQFPKKWNMTRSKSTNSIDSRCSLWPVPEWAFDEALIDTSLT